MTDALFLRLSIVLTLLISSSLTSAWADENVSDRPFELLVKSLPTMTKKTDCFFAYAEKDKNGQWPAGEHSRLTAANQFGKHQYKITIGNYVGDTAYSQFVFYIKYFDQKFTVYKREYGPGKLSEFRIDRDSCEVASFKLSVLIDAWSNEKVGDK